MNPVIGGRLAWARACRDARWVARAQPRRRIFGFGVGTSKTGSHSLAAMFAGRYRAVHEAEPLGVARLMRGRARGRLTEAEIGRRIQRRVARMNLELDVAPFHGPFVEHYAELFPGARCVHLHRDVYSWFDAQVNQHVGRYAPFAYREIRRHLYGAQRATDPREGALVEYGMGPLRSYLLAWADQNRRMLASLPDGRTLRVRTFELSRKVEELADFFAVPVETLNAERAHAFSARVKLGVIERIDADYFNAAVREICGDVMDALYPEMKDSRDAGFHAGR